MLRTTLAAMLAALMLVASVPARAVLAAEASQAELEALKKELEALRKQVNSTQTTVKGSAVDKAVAQKYGSSSNNVTTKAGKLSISGLVQVWYYSIENDNTGLFEDPDINGIVDTNEQADNDSFRIRRTEVKFTMDIHENIQAVVMIDPAREATSFPSFPSNQGTFKRRQNRAPEFDADGSTTAVANVQTGSGGVPRLLQDAYILYHGVVPHHDFQIGQFKPFFGEEGIRSSSQLDFVERSILGQIGDARDMGVTVLGKWWDDRFQYQLGLFNGAGNLWQSGGQYQNRSDDNDEKDFVGRVLVRPLWKKEKWGSLELGYSFRCGTKGETGADDPSSGGAPNNGLNRNQANAIAHGAWFSYLPGGPVRGWWIKGEYMFIRDRNSPGALVDLQDGGTISNGRTNSGDGFYVATGYKIGDSIWKDSAPSWLKGFEFAARYEQFLNVQVADLVDTAKTDDFATRAYTAGINYYIKGHNAKIQLNYILVDDPDEDDNASRSFGQVDNNSLVVNFQVAF